MSSLTIDSVFADLNDFELCNCWCKAIADVQPSGGPGHQEPLPGSWQIIRNVWGHLGLWGNGGMQLLLDCDQDDLDFFSDALIEIGELSAGEWIRSSLDSMGRDRLMEERFLLSDEFASAARELDRNSKFHMLSIERSLATYARHHRAEALPLIERISAINHVDRNEKSTSL